MATALILEDALLRSGLPARVEAVQAFEAALGSAGRRPRRSASRTRAAPGPPSRPSWRPATAGAPTALVTVSDRSPGGRLADVVVATEEADQSWCHTVGYLSPILAALAVAGHLTGRRPDPLDVRAALAAGLDQAAAAEAIAAQLADATTILTVASGADRPAARELALKIEEATWLPTTMRDLETLLHGHLPATGPQTGLVLLLADGDHLDERALAPSGALAAAEVLGLRTAAILSARGGRGPGCGADRPRGALSRIAPTSMARAPRSSPRPRRSSC